MNKDLLCEAFCSELQIREVPAGFAVRTVFTSRDGDAIGFYVTRHPSDPNLWRVEDSGLVIPMIEAAGVNLDAGVRAHVFSGILAEYGVTYDDHTSELRSEYVQQSELPSEAMRFVALLLRVQDLELLSSDTVASTFRDDVVAHLLRAFSGKLDLSFRVPPHTQLGDFEADVVIKKDSKSLALYFATTDERVNEAVILWMESRQRQIGLSVAMMLEREKPPHINNRSLRRAMNRLDSTTVYRGDETGSLLKIASLVGFESATLQ